jgi:CHAT domain-containing protein
MQDYFTYLANGQSYTEALRAAQLKRIAERREKNGGAHPFFWAAWTVTGN